MLKRVKSRSGQSKLGQSRQSQLGHWLVPWVGVILTACASQPQVQPTPTPAPTASPLTLSPSPSPSIPAPPSPSPTPQQQVYREKSGLFQISFPRGYTHKTTGSGVAFISGDQGFAGAIDYGSAEGKQLNTQQLEASLKAEFTNRLQEVKWQTSQVQPDGSLRIDWTGKDKTGNNLDAVSMVEQRGNLIFVLNLFGVNKPYQNYNADAEAIVNSYQIQPSPTPVSKSSTSTLTPTSTPASTPKPKNP